MTKSREFSVGLVFVLPFLVSLAMVFPAGPSTRAADAAEAGHEHQMGAHSGEHAHMGGKAKALDIPEAFRQALGAVYEAYFSVHGALFRHDLAAAKGAFARVGEVAERVDMTPLHGHAHEAWMMRKAMLRKSANAGAAAESLGQAREYFAAISSSAIAIDRQFGHPGGEKHYVLFCPMALKEKGAEWLQASEEVSNPYLGEEMKRCGEVRARLPE